MGGYVIIFTFKRQLSFRNHHVDASHMGTAMMDPRCLLLPPGPLMGHVILCVTSRPIEINGIAGHMSSDADGAVAMVTLQVGSGSEGTAPGEGAIF